MQHGVRACPACAPGIPECVRAPCAGLLPAGVFPREMTVAPSGRTLLVTCFGSGQLELVSLTGPL